jgi:hypothetical protein
MMVATRLSSPKSWHEMLGNVVLVSPSQRVRYDRLMRMSDPLGVWTNLDTTNHTVPHGMDNVRAFSRNFMPGYLQFVPAGLSVRFLSLSRMSSAAYRSRRSLRSRRCS